jgi:hypothetical protein
VWGTGLSDKGAKCDPAVRSREKHDIKFAEDEMKRSLLVVGVSAMLMIAWSVGRVQGQQEQANGKEKVTFVSADQANFNSMAPGVSWAPLWGDSSQGAHGTFTKFAAGYDSGMHTHTNDVWIVVVKGAYLYKDDCRREAGRAGLFLACSRWKEALERRRCERGSRVL